MLTQAIKIIFCFVAMLFPYILSAKALDSSLTKSGPTQKENRKTMQVMIEAHQIFSEAWRLMIDGSSSINSILKESLIALNSNNKTKQTAASWIWKNDELDFIAHPNQLPKGVGESLAMLNQDVHCKIKVNENNRIQRLSCNNLGQGLMRSQHVLFSKFEYDIKKDPVLEAEADRFENLFTKIGCVSKTPCLRMNVPAVGIIQIVENKKGINKSTEQAKQASSQDQKISTGMLNEGKVLAEKMLKEQNFQSISNQEENQNTVQGEFQANEDNDEQNKELEMAGIKSGDERINPVYQQQLLMQSQQDQQNQQGQQNQQIPNQVSQVIR